MISFRDGILRIETSPELTKSKKLRFVYEICLYLGIVCYYIQNSTFFHYGGTFLFIAGTAIITYDKIRSYRINKLTLAVWYLGFIILGELSALWAYSPAISAFKYLRMMLMILAICFGITQYADTSNAVDRFLDVYLYSSLTTALIQFIGTPIEKWFTGYFGIHVGDNSSNTFGYILLFAAIISFNKAYNNRQRLWYVGTVFFLIGCVLSSSRKAVAISTFGILCIIFFSFRRKYHFIHFMIAIVSAFFVLELLLTNEYLYRIIGVRITNLIGYVKGSSTSTDYNSLYLRDFYISFAKELFKDHPILGNGFVSFHSLLADATDMGTGYAHNNYWEILADLGLVGFISYYWFYAYCLYRVIVRIIKRNFRNIHLLAAVMLVSELILEWGVVSLYQPYCQMVIGMIYLCSCVSNGSIKKYYYSAQNRGE